LNSIVNKKLINMKKITIALSLVLLAHIGANAQTKNSRWAENYPVCKGSNGYHICGHHAGYTTANATTYSDLQSQQPASENGATPSPCNSMSAAMKAPTYMGLNEPGGFTLNTISSYQGYYPVREHVVKVSYENALAPYEGLPSPQDDGPKKNQQRNLNYNTSNGVDLPSSSGRPY
jgi:hypothetical protein